MTMFRLLLANLLVASVLAVKEYPSQCIECGCMHCLSATKPFVDEAGKSVKKVIISSDKCAPDTVNFMCCTGSRTQAGGGEAAIPPRPPGPPGTPIVFPSTGDVAVGSGWDGYCKVTRAVSPAGAGCVWSTNRCDRVSSIEVEVPANAQGVRMQGQHGNFISADPRNTQACGSLGIGVALVSSNACHPNGQFGTGICDDWVDLTKCTTDGSVIGDPHFQAWGGQWYDFHGACDLVFLSNPSFQDNLGMDVHIRTTLRDDFSFIESAALRIGTDVLEVSGWGEYIYNGVASAEFPFTLGGYPVQFQQVDMKKYRFDIYYAEGQGIRIQTVKDLVNVQMVNASMHEFEDSVGLLGHFGGNQLLSRDGNTDYFLTRDFDTFGLEWQVQPNEGMLFDDAREPQAPKQCIMPAPKSSEIRHLRRLGEASVTQEAAEEVCAQYHAEEHARKLCVSDVIALNDLEVADAGAF